MRNKMIKKNFVLLAWYLSLSTCALESVSRSLAPVVIKDVERCIAKMPLYRTKDLTPASVIPDNLKKAVSAFEMQGWRDEAEDAIDILTKNEWMAFGLFDGHGGKDVAKALVSSNPATRILQVLLELVVKTGKVDNAQIAAAYVQVDAHLELLSSGSTAIVCLINTATKEGFFINLGDSRAVALKQDDTYVSTVDHSPDTPQELARIEAAGGKVIWHGCWRVNGSLAVSRSFGDFHCKPLVNEKRQYHVGIEPEVISFKLDSVKTIVLACDGVWDVVQNEHLAEVIAIARMVPAYSCAECLCKAACWLRSTDNISALVIDVAKLPMVQDRQGESANQLAVPVAVA